MKLLGEDHASFKISSPLKILELNLQQPKSYQILELILQQQLSCPY
jgi:hypothetical protein